MTSKRIPPWLLTVSTFAVAIATIVMMMLLRRSADASLRTSLDLAQFQNVLTQLDGLDSQSFYGGKVDKASLQALHELNTQAEQALQVLLREAPGGLEMQQSQTLYQRYWQALQRTLELRSQRQFEQAHRVDRQQVDPTFEALGTLVSHQSQTAIQQVRQADQIADRGAAVTILLAALVISMIAQRIQHSKVRAEQAIAEQLVLQARDVTLQASLQQKELLLREIHHRIKNNLQIISSLLDLQAVTSQDPKVLQMLQENQDRIMAISLVHEYLYQSPDLERLNFAQYAETLLEQILSTYSLTNIQLYLDLEPIFLNLDTVLPCSLLLNELITNALKHAFPRFSQGEIWVEFHASASSILTLNVTDNGVGLPPALEIEKCPTLGLQMVSDLTRQLRGTLKVKATHTDENADRPGTCFQITFSELVYRNRT